MTHPAKSGFSRILLLAFGLLWVTAPPQALASGEIYKWVDAAGQTHYSQLPPSKGTPAIEVRPARAPAAGSGGEEARLQQQVEAMDQQLAAEDKAKSDAAIEAENARIIKENCKTARKNLAGLQHGSVKRYRTSDGEVIRMTEEDRQQRIEQANSQIQEFCK